VSSNTGPGSLQREDNHENEKIRWGHLKIFKGTVSIILLKKWLEKTLQKK
jgi:hypothetical protein